MGQGTLNDLFRRSCERFRRPDRLRALRDGRVVGLSTDEVERAVDRVAALLAAHGVAPGDRVAILSYNRPEWAIADYAVLALGAASVPIYTTLPPDPVAFILADSGAKAVFVEDAAQLAKVRAARARAPDLKVVIGIDVAGEGVVPFAADAGDPAAVRSRSDAVRPDDLATLIYTSGTTGVPKVVMLTHRNLVSNAEASLKVLDLGPADDVLSFLPLSHVFERLVDYAVWEAGASIAYPRSLDTVADDLALLRPTMMAAVPRFYEKVRGRVLANVASAPPARQRIFRWALRTGAQAAAYRRRGESLPLCLGVRHALANRLVFRKVHARTGGRIRFFVSGGAPLSPEVCEFFWHAGLPILEGYGLTETSPVIAVNSFAANRAGTVGRPVDGVEVRIAADGEILVRGPNVMKGYFGRPDETAEVLHDGWLHTGDIGLLDDGGFLKITDRKKEIFKTSGGKYIAPQPLENRLKESPLVANAVIVGANRRFAAALLVPNFEAVAARLGSADGPPDTKALVADPRLREILAGEVERANEGLAPYETIKKFAVLARDFTIEEDELTPTLKIKRRVIDRRYADVIEGLYREGE